MDLSVVYGHAKCQYLNILIKKLIEKIKRVEIPHVFIRFVNFVIKKISFNFSFLFRLNNFGIFVLTILNY